MLGVVSRKKGFMRVEQEGAGVKTFTFFLLSAKCVRWKKMDASLAARYKSLLNGQWPSRMQWDHVLDLMSSSMPCI